MNPHLLVTKIVVPTRRADVLRRQRLLDFIHEHIDRKLLLVSASAGYGKTSLLVDFADDTELPICWYSLDPNDTDPHLFLEYLVASIQREFPHFGSRTMALLGEGQPARNLDALIGALVTDIHQDIDSFFVLVLDDYHLVEASPPVNHLLDRLLYHLPENAHLILSSRTIPANLTLTRLAARMQVAGLGVGDLRFTADEIRALMQHNYRLEITPEVANELAEQSEGWIAGIVLTTPTLWRGLFKEWIKGYGPGSQLFDYLAAEVMAQQPEDLASFLLEASVLPQMDATLCSELLSRTDAKGMLQLAEKRNLFLTRVEDHEYRYHHLFRDFLQAQLRQNNPVRYADLHRRAAGMFERRRKLDRAIEHWLAAGDYAAAAQDLEILANEYYEQGRWTTLTRWLDALPPEVLQDRAELLLVRAQLAAESGEPDKARESFALARQAFERREEPFNVARVVFEEAKYLEYGDRVLEDCRRAAQSLPSRDRALNALAQRTLGGLLSRRGDLEGALVHFERAAELYSSIGDRHHHALVEHDRGVISLLVGKRAEAFERFETAAAYWRKVEHDGHLANILNSTAVAQYNAGQLDRAQELLQAALAHARKAGHLRIEAFALASLGDIYRDQGDLTAALKAYTDSSDIADKIRESFLITYTRVAVGEVWRLSRDYDTAERVLQTAQSAGAAHQSDYEVALAQTAFGALRLEQGDLDAAVQHLEDALRLLGRMKAPRELGRVHFFLGLAALRRGDTARAVSHLRELAAIGKTLEEDQFVLAEASRAKDLLDLARRRRIGTAYFSAIASKLGESLPREPVAVEVFDVSWPRLEICMLGEARVLMNGIEVEKGAWQTATTKELFFFFAAHPHPWRKEQIIEQLWPNALLGQANDLFHSSVYRIRRALFPELLVFRNGLYQINPEAARWTDVDAFEDYLAQAERATSDAERVEPLSRAVELYRGDFLDEFYADWCSPRREQLRMRHRQALSRLARAWVALGNASRGLELYQQALRMDSLDEETYRELIELHAKLGNRAAAIQTYQQCVTTLASELGIAPMPETVALYRKLVDES